MAGCFSRVPCIQTGSEYVVAAMTWKQELLSVEFVDRLWNCHILILISERLGLQVEKTLVEMFASHPKSQIMGHGPWRWTILARSVRGGSDQGHGTSFRTLAYILKGKFDCHRLAPERVGWEGCKPSKT
jgi:hypothetical protein